MKPLFFLVISLIVSTITLSCFPKNRTNKNTTTLTKEKNLTSNAKPQDAREGVILPTKNASCPYLLVISGLKDTLDPINLQDFTKDIIPTKVWVTFSNLKMKNRCNQGRPVLIQSLKNRSITEQ